ncbi:malonate-semialdehyde dehydrogenase (acetylating)/methylmalonate-semialdehyde dehydrogenase [Thermosporothrix hazakensis]|jgi:malonate-semialdehyde dehydrogenase (acetylating)/methylmalonate-semialdehyde dehydrogenase|uniref:methylmalonate-semialdehyde dehydrogenase (CoA acylating) n=1 Tax=Thermosporothrix hazakensis TaxID=644383 RepID=A0A326UJS1_THEHA|nr:CoA-acylating methylmalonate-semialdehyde dehydrogenase [Thermosporothrix hazakensis]PZW29287.1 malonate-semialdehyde dehydrogenase (acetylating)/methylmalonate-semialdehyde dehydrogenase [Thermosporothrix hazakensis]GCE45360.1 methylmalonate-semialdehyde dehydrogenase [Thermosporothrix hazakensis]
MLKDGKLLNFIGGMWKEAQTSTYLKVYDPATAEALAEVPLSSAQDVDAAAQAARLAWPAWRRTPPTDRVQYLFKLKSLLEQHLDEIAQLITRECGKTLAEAKGELQRGIENIEVATGIPSLMMGYNVEDIARGIDEHLFRQPVGVVAAITPFNFPGMIPLWFLPYALACGNCFVLKPSEKVPLTMNRVFDLIEQLGLPAGVVNLVNGAKETVDAILDHPVIRAISFVGSSPVARYVYSRAAANGKRAQCQGGAKNTVVVLPDADMEMTTRIVADSSFGCSGQRCLATSVAITVGDARKPFTERIAEAAHTRKVGYGLDPAVEMGPVITSESKQRIESLIQSGVQEGAKPLVDGRNAAIPGYENGYFVRPTILDEVNPEGNLARTEIFGPVLSLLHVKTVDEAIRLVNESSYGNMACLFTSSGAAARKFRYEAQAGNIGINIGVAAPMAFFPFSGWKDSFFGDMHAQGRDAIEFYTEKKVVVERWPKEWSRTF